MDYDDRLNHGPLRLVDKSDLINDLEKLAVEAMLDVDYFRRIALCEQLIKQRDLTFDFRNVDNCYASRKSGAVVGLEGINIETRRTPAAAEKIIGEKARRCRNPGASIG